MRLPLIPREEAPPVITIQSHCGDVSIAVPSCVQHELDGTDLSSPLLLVRYEERLSSASVQLLLVWADTPTNNMITRNVPSMSFVD